MANEPSIDRLRRSSILIFGVVLIAYFIVGTVKLVIENYHVQQDTARLQSDVDRLQQRNTELQSLLAYYQTESYKEKEARARLGFQKPGERLVVVPAPAPDQLETIIQPGIQTQPATPTSNPKQWLEYFTKHGGARHV